MRAAYGDAGDAVQAGHHARQQTIISGAVAQLPAPISAPSPNCSIPFQRGRVCVTARNVTHGGDAPVFDGQVSLACGTVAELTTRIGAPFPQQAAGFELKGIVASTGN